MPFNPHVPAPLSAAELLAHAGWVRRLARTLVADPASADDLAQETWVAALGDPPARARLGPWLVATLRNRARQLRRSNASRGVRERLTALRGDPAPRCVHIVPGSAIDVTLDVP